MKVVRSYTDFDVNIFMESYDDTCRRYVITEKIKKLDRVKPITGNKY